MKKRPPGKNGKGRSTNRDGQSETWRVDSRNGIFDETLLKGKHFSSRELEKFKGRKILLVDDNPDVLWLLDNIIKNRLGMEVVTAPDGMDALKRARETMPDLILMDLMMPVMNGLEVAKELKKDKATRAIPLIGLTALIRTYPLARVLEAGFVDLLIKPFDFEDFLRITHPYVT